MFRMRQSWRVERWIRKAVDTRVKRGLGERNKFDHERLDGEEPTSFDDEHVEEHNESTEEIWYGADLSEEAERKPGRNVGRDGDGRSSGNPRIDVPQVVWYWRPSNIKWASYSKLSKHTISSRRAAEIRYAIFKFDNQACDSAVSPRTLGISNCTSTAHVCRLFQHVSKFPGVNPSSAMNVNARICTCATDSNLESF